MSHVSVDYKTIRLIGQAASTRSFNSLAWGNNSIRNSCLHNHLLVAYATLKKEAENPDFIHTHLLGQSLTKLAITYAIAIWLANYLHNGSR